LSLNAFKCEHNGSFGEEVGYVTTGKVFVRVLEGLLLQLCFERYNRDRYLSI
jgi:hypothetical protein